MHYAVLVFGGFTYSVLLLDDVLSVLGKDWSFSIAAGLENYCAILSKSFVEDTDFGYTQVPGPSIKAGAHLQGRRSACIWTTRDMSELPGEKVYKRC